MTAVHDTEMRMAALRRREASFRRLRHIAKLLDSSVVIPGIGVRIGADAILGLVPGIGDMAMGLVGAYLIYEAHRLGAPKTAIARMIGNVAMDTAIGAIPFVGDIWDFFFRSNDRNMQILAKHVGGLPLDLPYETVR